LSKSDIPCLPAGRYPVAFRQAGRNYAAIILIINLLKILFHFLF
jgi:hypothetical protein